LALEDPKGMVVSHFDLATAHQLLPFHLQVRGYEYDVGCEDSDGGLWRSLERSGIEILV
jgi:hypothetical protein